MLDNVSLIEMRKLISLADQCALEANEYLEKGFSPENITGLFARIFSEHFKIRLSEKALERIPRGRNGSQGI